MLLVLLTICTVASTHGFGAQKLCVDGKLRCPGDNHHSINQVVRLVDADSGPNPDDNMGATLSDENGDFKVCGSATDIIGSIEPVLKIYTKCNFNGSNASCSRELTIPIDSSHLKHGKFTFDKPIDLTGKGPQADYFKANRERETCYNMDFMEHLTKTPGKFTEIMSRWGKDYAEKAGALRRNFAKWLVGGIDKTPAK